MPYRNTGLYRYTCHDLYTHGLYGQLFAAHGHSCRSRLMRIAPQSAQGWALLKFIWAHIPLWAVELPMADRDRFLEDSILNVPIN